jgi:hypothetical protein
MHAESIDQQDEVTEQTTPEVVAAPRHHPMVTIFTRLARSSQRTSRWPRGGKAVPQEGDEGRDQ